MNTSEENSPDQSDKRDSTITLENEKMFNKLANFCLLNPIKNEWKTLCNACLNFRCKMIERFVSHDDDQIECEVYLNENQIKCDVKCFTRVDAEICIAKFFIQKYATIHTFSQKESQKIVTGSPGDNEHPKLNLLGENSSSQSDEDTNSSITPESEKMFNEIANLCMLNPIKNEWKTFCNACLSLKYKMIHRFVFHEGGQYECVVYLNRNQIKCGVKCSTHLNAGISTAKYFIQKYSTIHNTLDEALYERIASLCQSNSYKDDWKALCNTCKLYKFKYREQIYKKKNDYFCEIFIKDKLLDLVGRGKTELKAAIDLAQQFMEKYYKPKTIELNQNLAHCTFQDKSKHDSINLIENPFTIRKTVGLNQSIFNPTFQEEPKLLSVKPNEKLVTITKTSDLNQNLAHSTFQEDSKYCSISPIEKPTIPKKANYEGVFFLTY